MKVVLPAPPATVPKSSITRLGWLALPPPLIVAPWTVLLTVLALCPASVFGLVGFGSLVVTSLIVFFALQDAFDEVWEVPVVAG